MSRWKSAQAPRGFFAPSLGNWPERACKVCGKIYKPVAPKQKLCSEACRSVRRTELDRRRKR